VRLEALLPLLLKYFGGTGYFTPKLCMSYIRVKVEISNELAIQATKKRNIFSVGYNDLQTIFMFA